MAGAVPFFADCGFERPEHKDFGSFLQEVTSSIGQLEFATPALRAQKGIPSKEELADVLKGHRANPYESACRPFAAF